MSDRTLLESAAKVVGEWPSPEPFEHVLRRWNPLTDDGDAFRLAVTLNLVVCVMPVGFTGVYLPAEHVGGKYDEVQHHDADPYAATRRAIVRAAAAIGEKL